MNKSNLLRYIDNKHHSKIRYEYEYTFTDLDSEEVLIDVCYGPHPLRYPEEYFKIQMLKNSISSLLGTQWNDVSWVETGKIIEQDTIINERNTIFRDKKYPIWKYY